MTERLLMGTDARRLRSDRNHLLCLKLLDAEAIRLLEVAPGLDDQQIELQVLICELGHCPPFDAISYVWGDESQRIDVFCNNRVLSVTKSLAAALHTIRLPDQTRLVWADAICINQEDKDEKSHHVTFMRKVYASACNVLICMGPDPNNAGKDITSLLDSHTKRRSRHSTFASMPVLKDDDATFFDPRWRSLSFLMKNAWWTRAWTLQESGVASPSIVLLGQASVDYRALMELNRWIVACAGTLQTTFHIPVETIHSDWGQWTGGFQSQQDYPYAAIDFLNQAKCLRCKDPRDHVYAFIGHPLLQKEDGSGSILTVNYNLPVTEIFQSLTRWLLSHDVFISSVISTLQFPRDIATWAVEDIPSWAVEKAAPALTKSPVLLSILDRIRSITTSPNSNSPCKYSAIQREDALSLTLTSGLINYLPAEDDMTLHRANRDAFWAVFHTGLTQASVNSPAAEIGSVRLGPDDARNLYAGSADQYFYDLSLACKGRCFFIAEDGSWGVGPWVMQVDDEILIVQGARVPFIFRCNKRYSDGVQDEMMRIRRGTNEDLSYLIMGEAYVHGAMRGEVVRHETS